MFSLKMTTSEKTLETLILPHVQNSQLQGGFPKPVDSLKKPAKA